MISDSSNPSIRLVKKVSTTRLPAPQSGDRTLHVCTRLFRFFSNFLSMITLE